MLELAKILKQLKTNTCLILLMELKENDDGSVVKNLPVMQEMQVWSLDWEDPLEDGMATHSSILAWRIPGMGEPGGLPSLGSHRFGHDWSDLAAAAWKRKMRPSTPWLLKLSHENNPTYFCLVFYWPKASHVSMHEAHKRTQSIVLSHSGVLNSRVLKLSA